MAVRSRDRSTADGWIVAATTRSGLNGSGDSSLVPRWRVTRNDGPKTALPAVAPLRARTPRLPACLVSFPAVSTSTVPSALVGRQARLLIPKATVKPSTVTRPVAGPLCS